MSYTGKSPSDCMTRCVQVPSTCSRVVQPENDEKTESVFLHPLRSVIQDVRYLKKLSGKLFWRLRWHTVWKRGLYWVCFGPYCNPDHTHVFVQCHGSRQDNFCEILNAANIIITPRGCRKTRSVISFVFKPRCSAAVGQLDISMRVFLCCTAIFFL